MKTHPSSVRAVPRAASLMSLLLAAAFLPAGRAATFTKYVDSSALPENAAISTVSTAGTAVAIEADYTNLDGSSGTAVYYLASPGATPVLIANLQTMSPSGGGVFTSLGSPVVSGSTVIFQG